MIQLEDDNLEEGLEDSLVGQVVKVHFNQLEINKLNIKSAKYNSQIPSKPNKVNLYSNKHTL